jgi:hypothetical protein
MDPREKCRPIWLEHSRGEEILKCYGEERWKLRNEIHIKNHTITHCKP